MEKCLICKSANVTKEFESGSSVTSFSTPIKLPIEVYLCDNCGHIFNSPKLLPSDFYENEYALLLENEESEFVVFDGVTDSSLFDTVLNFIFQKVSLDKIGDSFKILEVGAGKGILLKKIRNYISKPVSVYAVEPNKNSESYLHGNLTGCEISMSTLEDSPFKNDQFNLILSHGVLEHVSDPEGFLKNIYNCMSSNSILYIGVPNFMANPADIVTIDHLSKFIPQTIECLFKRLGFKIIASNASKTTVFMTYLLQKNDDTETNAFTLLESEAKTDSRKTLKESIEYVTNSLKGFKEGLDESIKNKKYFSIYGAGNIGLFAAYYFNVEKNHIHCIYDDNSTFWGTSRIGIPIKNPKDMASNKDGIIYISANTCYHDMILKKINLISDKKASIYPRTV